MAVVKRVSSSLRAESAWRPAICAAPAFPGPPAAPLDLAASVVHANAHLHGSTGEPSISVKGKSVDVVVAGRPGRSHSQGGGALVFRTVKVWQFSHGGRGEQVLVSSAGPSDSVKRLPRRSGWRNGTRYASTISRGRQQVEHVIQPLPLGLRGSGACLRPAMSVGSVSWVRRWIQFSSLANCVGYAHATGGPASFKPGPVAGETMTRWRQS